ncbi:PREDICTED: clumping factor B-like isoform X2 [Branchiostoma belcheri]|uniref:Clumping factor B-like isoform X2 n=1 Tax=Branchiostoma belcheri TaxID=7741 RepID=A0A6P4YN35_BRABE|nr:PREDICTED: clumping factor B-like isoform X2 [Branchiostoma belcheri]
MSQRARFCQRREALQKLQHRARRLPDDIVSKPRSVVQRDDELQIKVLAQLFIAQVRTPPRPSGYCARSSPVEDSPSPDPESRVPDISCDSDRDRDGSTPGKYDVLQAEESDSDSETDSGSECDSGSESDSGEEDDTCRSRLDTICEEEKEEAICGEEEDTICEEEEDAICGEEEEEEDANCGEKDADCEKEEDAICGEEEDCEEEEDAICGEKDAICEEEDANCGEEKDANCGEEKDANCGEEEDAICGEEDANCGEEDASFDDVDLESLSSNQSEYIRGKKRGTSRKTKWWRKLCCWLRQEDTDDELE